MNPKPLLVLKNFTVPIVMSSPDQNRCSARATARTVRLEPSNREVRLSRSGAVHASRDYNSAPSGDGGRREVDIGSYCADYNPRQACAPSRGESCHELARPGFDRAFEPRAPARSLGFIHMWIQSVDFGISHLPELVCGNAAGGIPSFGLDAAEAKGIICFHGQNSLARLRQ